MKHKRNTVYLGSVAPKKEVNWGMVLALFGMVGMGYWVMRDPNRALR